MAPLTLGSTSYEKAVLPFLANAGGMCVDMHFHTNFSDGSAGVRDVLDRLFQSGIGVAITDHNEIRGSLEAERLSEGKIKIIPGIEVNCLEGRELLVYFHTQKDLIRFYENEIAPYRGFNPAGKIKRKLIEVAEGAKIHGGIVSAAHPFGFMGKKNLHRWVAKNGDQLLKSIDLIESNNGAASKKKNERARSWANELGMPTTGGSDGHTLDHLGGVVTWADTGNSEEFLELAMSGSAAVVGKKASLLKSLGAMSIITRRHLIYYLPLLRRLVSKYDPRAVLARASIDCTHPEYAEEPL